MESKDRDGIDECFDGKRRIVDPRGRVCELVANADRGFWVMPMTGASGFGLYVRVDDPMWDGKASGPYVANVEGGRS